MDNTHRAREHKSVSLLGQGMPLCLYMSPLGAVDAGAFGPMGLNTCLFEKAQQSQSIREQGRRLFLSWSGAQEQGSAGYCSKTLGVQML